MLFKSMANWRWKAKIPPLWGGQEGLFYDQNN